MLHFNMSILCCDRKSFVKFYLASWATKMIDFEEVNVGWIFKISFIARYACFNILDAELSLTGNKLISGRHCFIERCDNGEVWLHDTR